MITKAIIKQLNSSNNNHCLVFIPLLKKANATEADATVDATFITIRGIDNIYKVGDVVFVDFEDGEYNKPVILGKLFVERDDPDDVTTTIVAKATQTTTTSKLPESTYLGENTSDSLVTKVERAEYLSESNYENKQDKLISGTNLKTVNGESLLGTGNIAISETGDDLVTITTPQTISGAKTLSSTLSLATNFYYDSANTCGLNANNSDIIGINGLYTHDLANGTAEGLRFYADGDKWDTLTSSNGTLYYRAGGTLLNEDFATAYKVYHTGNLSTATASSNGLMSSSDKSNLDNHISNTSNPHSVTKTQVGLGSVVNTADSATPIEGGTTKFTTGGAYTELAKKLSLSGGKLSGAVTFANNTWNTMGDDCKIGDFNKAGTIGIMGAGNGGSTNTTLAFCKVGDASTYKTITFDGTTLSMDGYASSAGNSTTVGGYTPKVTGEWGTIPVIKGPDGVMEIGKYIDFHATAVGDQTGGGNDHDGRIMGQVGGGTLTIPQKSGTIAVTGDIPVTLPNPNVIKFKDKDNNDASYNGASELDLSGGIYYATTAGSAGSATKAAQDSGGNIISDTYVKKSGDTFSQGAFFLFPDTGNWSANNSGVTFPYSCGGFKWVEQSDWVQLSCEATSSDNCNLVLQFGDDNSNKLSVRNYSGAETASITASGAINGSAIYQGGKQVISGVSAASGEDIGGVGTPSVSASTSGGSTTLTFHNLKGAKGDKGDPGDAGKDGKDGTNGTDGKDGKDGEDGVTPHIGENGNWYIGDTDTGVKAEGSDGKDGKDGSVAAVDSALSGTSTNPVQNKVVKVALDGKQAAGSYAAASHTHTKSQITDFPTIPTKTSQLTNDSGFEFEKTMKAGFTLEVTSNALAKGCSFEIIQNDPGDEFAIYGYTGTEWHTLFPTGLNWVCLNCGNGGRPYAWGYKKDVYYSCTYQGTAYSRIIVTGAYCHAKAMNGSLDDSSVHYTSFSDVLTYSASKTSVTSSANKYSTSTSISEATATSAGLMSAADKNKLNGLETHVQADWNQSNTSNAAYIRNKPGNASTTSDGFMSAGDYTRLHGIAENAEVNVQSDWNETNENSDAFIKNKPEFKSLTINKATSSEQSTITYFPTSAQTITLGTQITMDWNSNTGTLTITELQ